MGDGKRRQRQVGYIAAQRIDAALMSFEEIIRDARHLINNPVSSETRFSKLGHILDQAYQGRDQLKEIRRTENENSPFAAESFHQHK